MDAPRRVTAVLGPTNTGKTHHAIERMLSHRTGVIGLPLRLLAREVYDRIVAKVGPSVVALVTGEERIVPERTQYWVCTTEAMPLEIGADFVAVDEIQLCADADRGHVFTDRLLRARGLNETLFLGSDTMRGAIAGLVPHVTFLKRDRMSTLTYAGSKKISRMPERSAIVGFSVENVYAIAELIRRQKGGCAVVMGALSPRTRNAQVALYQNGDVDYLVATDAIGMGLNMDVDHVAFAGLRKFDGKKTRWLHPQEVGQIAGRAGRHVRDGTFGVTGEAEDMDEDLVLSVENHAFQAVPGAQWRNHRLDFDNLPSLIRSLDATPNREGLALSAEALDEQALKRLAEDADIVHRVRDRVALERLWEVCQTPDFRKQTSDEHLRLIRTLFENLTTGRRRMPEDWMHGQFKGLDRTDGEIDTLATRLAGVRTLAYVANRPDWLVDPAHWQGVTRGLEERLSDALHEKLMARFIDRRTSVLMRQLGERSEMLAGVAEDGTVTVEGHVVGRLQGLTFQGAKAASSLEEKALRGAAQRAVGPEVTRRLGQLAGEDDDAFSVTPDGAVLWHGAAAGQIVEGGKVRLLGELGPETARERARQRLQAFLAAERERRLAPLVKLEQAMAAGQVKGLPRGIGHRLVEAGGLLDRRVVEADLKALSQAERRTLRTLGVRIGAFSLFMPGLLEPEALAFAQAMAGGAWRPPLEALSRLPTPAPDPRVLAARGLRAVGPFAVPTRQLEALDELLRAGFKPSTGIILGDAAREGLGWTAAEAGVILRALGFTPISRTEPIAWRRRNDKPAGAAAPPPAHSPFAALAGLKVAPPARRRRPKRRKPAAS